MALLFGPITHESPATIGSEYSSSSGLVSIATAASPLPPMGGKVLQVAPTGAAVAQVGRTSSATTVLVLSFFYRMVSISSGAAMFQAQGTNSAFPRFDFVNGTYQVQDDTGHRGTSIGLNTWTWLSILIKNESGTKRVRWSQDDVEQYNILSGSITGNFGSLILGTLETANTCVAEYDEVYLHDAESDYPVADPSMQRMRPDADVTTTGWASTPLFSKVNETSPDGTVITSTAA